MEAVWQAEHNANLMWVLSILSYTVIFNTFIYKIPQIYEILHTGTSSGLSLPSVTFETLGYSIMLTYQFAMDFPFETYAEYTLMVSQNILLLAVILIDRKKINLTLIPWTVLYTAGFVAISLRWFPDPVMIFFIGMTTPILCYSKLDQLLNIIFSGDAGVVSIATWFFVCYDTGVRMLTTAIITKDIPVFINLTTSEILNVGILISTVYFKKVAIKRNRLRRS